MQQKQVTWICISHLKRSHPLVRLGRVVRKPAKAYPGLKVNQSINFSSIKMFFIACVLCSLRFFKLKPEEQTIQTENSTQKLQNWNQNVQFQKMSILPTPPTEGIGISWGVGGSARPAMYEDQSEFPGGWGGLRKNPFRGGAMDIFWNYTILANPGLA